MIAASLTEAGPAQATALIVLHARQKSQLPPQETVTRYQVEVTLELGAGIIDRVTPASRPCS